MLKIILLILILNSNSFANESVFLFDKVKEYSQCEKIIQDECEYAICLLPKNKYYSNSLSIITPLKLDLKEIKKIRFHLHGHSFGQLQSGEDFDSSPQAIEKGFKLGAITCKAKQPIILPFSKGKCTDFDESLNESKDFDLLVLDLLTKLELNSTKIGIEVSAHSGGGRTVTRILKDIKYNPISEKASERIQKVWIFDGIYNKERKESYVKWLENSVNVSFNTYAIAPKEANQNYEKYIGSSPYNYSKDILSDLTSEKMALPFMKKGAFKVKASTDKSDLSFVYEQSYSSFQHWYILRDFWDSSFLSK